MFLYFTFYRVATYVVAIYRLYFKAGSSYPLFLRSDVYRNMFFEDVYNICVHNPCTQNTWTYKYRCI